MAAFSEQDFLSTANEMKEVESARVIVGITREEKNAQLVERIFRLLCLSAAFLPLLILAFLVGNTVISGLERIDLDFLTGFPSRFASKAGILPALIGTFYLMLLTTIIALPLGVASAIYLEEYAKDTWFKSLIELNVTNLAGVPSIIFGLLGLELFVRALGLGPSLVAGALTLSLLILPVMITATREALKTVPKNLREAGLALGGTKLSVTLRVVLPLAMSQIITGAILSIARAIGESAPIIVIGAATYLAFLPNGLLSEFSALPLQIFQWVERPQADFVENASGAIVVLLAILAIFNLSAAWLRHHKEKSRGSL
ncbi:MAG TPA: phosphate ABC transporter permease PstA [Myxococcota bacterium]|nr:phosphate ABC transporter permease PstA [Myxococcota bacterium]